MTWSDDRGGNKRRVKPAIFAEKAPAKKPVPSWIASNQAMPHALSGWLSSRSAYPSSATSAPPVAERRAPPGAPAQGTSVQPSPSVSAEGIIAQALEARSLFEAESAVQASRSAFPQGAERSFEAAVSRFPGATVLLGAETAEGTRLAATIAALEKSVEELSRLRGSMMEETEVQLVTLAAAIARRVIGREVSIDPEILLTLAAEGIDALGDRDRVVVRFGSLDRDDILASMIERLKRRAPRCEVLQDPSLAAGQCVVESEFGQVDESVDSRLDNVLRALLPGVPTRFGLP